MTSLFLFVAGHNSFLAPYAFWQTDVIALIVFISFSGGLFADKKLGIFPPENTTQYVWLSILCQVGSSKQVLNRITDWNFGGNEH